MASNLKLQFHFHFFNLGDLFIYFVHLLSQFFSPLVVLDGSVHICSRTRRSLVQFPVGRTFLLCAPVRLLQVQQFLRLLMEQKQSLWPWRNAQLKISSSSGGQIEASSSEASQWFFSHPSLRGRCFLPVLCWRRADQFPVWLHRQRHRAQPSSSWPATCTARWTHTTCLKLEWHFSGGWVIVGFWSLWLHTAITETHMFFLSKHRRWYKKKKNRWKTSFNILGFFPSVRTPEWWCGFENVTRHSVD